jgi:hypothetical protein
MVPTKAYPHSHNNNGQTHLFLLHHPGFHKDHRLRKLDMEGHRTSSLLGLLRHHPKGSRTNYRQDLDNLQEEYLAQLLDYQLDLCHPLGLHHLCRKVLQDMEDAE